MKRRIIFVDDEPAILEGLEDLLMRYRGTWDMAFAQSGPAALDRMREAPFDVIVTDMQMPEMNGATLLQAVKDEYPETIRIVLSGHAELEAVMRAAPVAHQFLHKPCQPRILETVVERACALGALLDDEQVRTLVGRLDHLPTAPETFAALQQVLADEQSGVAEVADIIEEDIGMSAKVLQMANSAFFGIGRPVFAIDRAVSFLGVRMIQQLVLAAELFSGDELPTHSGLSLQALRDHSLLTASVARRAASGSRSDADDAMTAGLLHDVGKLVLAVELPGHLPTAAAAARENAWPLYQAEEELYGVTHAEVGAYLLGVWGLPYPIVEAVANHHAPERVSTPGLDMLAAVHVADALAHEYEPGNGLCFAALNREYTSAAGLDEHLASWREYTEGLLAGTA